MSFVHSFRTELYKHNRTSTWYICFLLTLIIPLIMVMDYAEQEDISSKIDGNPWSVFIRLSNVFYNVLILPLFTLLVTTLVPQIEYKNNTWKQVLASPQSYLDIYMARYATVILMIVLFTIVHNILIVLTGLSIALLFPKYGFSNSGVDIVLLLKSAAHSLICVLGMSAAQFCMGMRFRNFIVPIAAGFIMWLLNIAMFEFHFGGAVFNPFSYLLLSAFSRYESSRYAIMIGSVGYCLLFLTAGFREWIFNREKIR
jgi:lantibiotic transport system permease protein